MLCDDRAKLLEKRGNILQRIFNLTNGAASILVPGILHSLFIVVTRLFVLFHIAACVDVLSGDVFLWLDIDSPPDIDTFLGAAVSPSLVAVFEAH